MEQISIPRKNHIFIVSAPSGCGKTTLCNHLIKRDENLIESISATTRERRKGEVDKRDYFFVDKKEFLDGIHHQEFLEWAEVFTHLYGTPRRFVEDVLKQKKDVLLNIDVQGAMKLRNKLPQAVFIFVLPPSFEELKRRLSQRKTESKTQIQKRLDLAKKESAYARRYDYVVINDELREALKAIRSIIQAERLKVK